MGGDDDVDIFVFVDDDDGICEEPCTEVVDVADGEAGAGHGEMIATITEISVLNECG